MDSKDIKEKIKQGHINTRVIIEVLGAPKEHVEKTLREYVERIKKDDDLVIIKEDYSKAEQKDKLWAIFVELEMLFKDIKKMTEFCFDYMPSSIEIIQPAELHYNSRDFEAFVNDLQARLHNLDMVVRKLSVDNKILEKNSAALLKNLITLSLKEKEKDIETLAKNVGIPSNQLKPFLEKMIKEGRLKEDGGKYSTI